MLFYLSSIFISTFNPWLFPLTNSFFFFLVCELNMLLCWPELRVLNSSERFTPCDFYKLFIYLFTLVPPLPVLFAALPLTLLWFLSHPFFILFLHHPLYLSIHFWLEYGGRPKRSRGLNGGHREWICIICDVALVHRHRERRCQPVQGELNSPRQLRD